jgi:ribosomal protein S4
MVSEHLDVNKSGFVPSWLQVTPDTMTITVTGLPRREDFQVPIQEQLIVELCSK